jgi:hypothetical protein
MVDWTAFIGGAARAGSRQLQTHAAARERQMAREQEMAFQREMAGEAAARAKERFAYEHGMRTATEKAKYIDPVTGEMTGYMTDVERFKTEERIRQATGEAMGRLPAQRALKATIPGKAATPKVPAQLGVPYILPGEPGAPFSEPGRKPPRKGPPKAKVTDGMPSQTAIDRAQETLDILGEVAATTTGDIIEARDGLTAGQKRKFEAAQRVIYRMKKAEAAVEATAKAKTTPPPKKKEEPRTAAFYEKRWEKRQVDLLKQKFPGREAQIDRAIENDYTIEEIDEKLSKE